MASSFAGWTRLRLSGCSWVCRVSQTLPRPASSGTGGKALLQKNCGRCHAIGAVGNSPLKAAPPMRNIYARFCAARAAGRIARGHGFPAPGDAADRLFRRGRRRDPGLPLRAFDPEIATDRNLCRPCFRSPTASSRPLSLAEFCRALAPPDDGQESGYRFPVGQAVENRWMAARKTRGFSRLRASSRSPGSRGCGCPTERRCSNHLRPSRYRKRPGKPAGDFLPAGQRARRRGPSKRACVCWLVVSCALPGPVGRAV